jgi:hypothetical protein
MAGKSSVAGPPTRFIQAPAGEHDDIGGDGAVSRHNSTRAAYFGKKSNARRTARERKHPPATHEATERVWERAVVHMRVIGNVQGPMQIGREQWLSHDGGLRWQPCRVRPGRGKLGRLLLENLGAFLLFGRPAANRIRRSRSIVRSRTSISRAKSGHFVLASRANCASTSPGASSSAPGAIIPAEAQVAPPPATPRSKISTEHPFCASRQPIASPATPAPTMMTFIDVIVSSLCIGLALSPMPQAIKGRPRDDGRGARGLIIPA